MEEFIRLAEERFRVINEGDLVRQHGLVEVESRKIMPIALGLQQIQEELGIGTPSGN